MNSADGSIDSVAALESCVGKTPGAVQLKVIDHLDEGARRWIGASPLAFVSFGSDREITIVLAGGQAGFAQTPDHLHMLLPCDALDESWCARAGQGFGALFLAPGLGETLRVNGQVDAVADGSIRIVVQECYVHCAKALIRSDFWNAGMSTMAPVEAGVFLALSRFMAVATIDAQGRADVSPKGDPAGALLRPEGADVWYADRPGNRRFDSFRNLLTQPRLAAIALIPGSTCVVRLSGQARITTDYAVREAFAIDGKTPRIATCIEAPTVTLYDSAALQRSNLWGAPKATELDPSAMFAAHVKLSKAGGLQARLLRSLVSPGLMDKGLQHDYKHNLY